jgi:hypothetical protein
MLIVLQFRAKYKQLWDDSMFAADRDGSDNAAGICLYTVALPSERQLTQ